MNKLHACIWCVLGLAFGLLLYSYYLLFFPVKTIDLLEEPMEVIPKQVARGTNNFVVKIHYMKYRDADIHTSRQLECEDGSLITMPTDERSFPLGEHTIFANHVVVPLETPLGMCKMVFTVSYQINPLRSIVQVFETEPFEIIEAGDTNDNR